MADPCVCEDNLEVTETGELCAIPGSIGLREILIYNSSDTFTKATYPWLARVRVYVVGGGGGGGGTALLGASQVAAGAGGGGGGAAEVVVDESALAAGETITVGAAGTAVAGAAGGAGGSSSFGAHAVATGGAGGDLGTAGSAFSATTIADGGVGTTGDVLYQGGDGEPGIRCNDLGGEASRPLIAIGGSGGGSIMGGRSMDHIHVVGGTTPSNSGQGGSGASRWTPTTAAAGAAGGAGVVIVELYA